MFEHTLKCVVITINIILIVILFHWSCWISEKNIYMNKDSRNCENKQLASHKNQSRQNTLFWWRNLYFSMIKLLHVSANLRSFQGVSNSAMRSVYRFNILYSYTLPSFWRKILTYSTFDSTIEAFVCDNVAMRDFPTPASQIQASVQLPDLLY